MFFQTSLGKPEGLGISCPVATLAYSPAEATPHFPAVQGLLLTGVRLLPSLALATRHLAENKGMCTRR